MLASCSREPPALDLGTRQQLTPAAARALEAVSAAAATLSARIAASRPRFDALAWFQAQGVDLEQTFHLPPAELKRLMRVHFDKCLPLSLRDVSVLACTTAEPTPDDPMTAMLKTTKIHFARDGKLLTAKTMPSGTVPVDTLASSPYVQLVLRADGDDLVVDEDPLMRCASTIEALRKPQPGQPDARRALEAVETICANRGRYRFKNDLLVRSPSRVR